MPKITVHRPVQSVRSITVNGVYGDYKAVKDGAVWTLRFKGETIASKLPAREIEHAVHKHASEQ